MEDCACCRARLKAEAAARAVMLECAASFSPRIEEASRKQGTACAFVLDITGTERLFGPPRALAERLRNALQAAGFRASIAVSANFHTARMLAAASRGITVIPAGEEAQALAGLPVALLEIPEDHAETLALWGIRTLGELAALPEVDLIARLGHECIHAGATWRSARMRMPFSQSRPHSLSANSASLKRRSSRWTRCCLSARA